jgi:hypothetical protein
LADVSDVETALVDAVSSGLYPGGLSSASIVGSGARMYRGWPMTAALDADLARGVINVSVSSMPNSARNTTRWGVYAWAPTVAPGVVVSTSGNVAEFSGVPNAGDVAGLLVDEVAYVYQTQVGDSAGLVAAALADLVRQDRICWLQGAVVTVPGATHLAARTMALQVSTAEWARQEQGFRIAVWSPSPVLRDAACSVIGSQLAQTSFLTLADQTGGRLRYRNTASFDEGQGAGVYRRDLVYDVEYATTVVSMLPAMMFGDLVFNGVSYFA